VQFVKEFCYFSHIITSNIGIWHKVWNSQYALIYKGSEIVPWCENCDFKAYCLCLMSCPTEFILVLLKLLNILHKILISPHFKAFLGTLLYLLHASVCKLFSQKMLLVNLLMVNHKCFSLVYLLGCYTIFLCFISMSFQQINAMMMNVCKVWSTARRWSSAKYQWRSTGLSVSIGGHETAAVWCRGPARAWNTPKDSQSNDAHDVHCKFFVFKLFYNVSVLLLFCYARCTHVH